MSDITSPDTPLEVDNSLAAISRRLWADAKWPTCNCRGLSSDAILSARIIAKAPKAQRDAFYATVASFRKAVAQ